MAAETRKTTDFTRCEQDINMLRKPQVTADPARERVFQFRPFAIDMHGALGELTTAVLAHFARKRMDRSTMNFGLCKWLGLQAISVVVQTAKARVCASIWSAHGETLTLPLNLFRCIMI